MKRAIKYLKRQVEKSSNFPVVIVPRTQNGKNENICFDILQSFTLCNFDVTFCDILHERSIERLF